LEEAEKNKERQEEREKKLNDEKEAFRNAIGDRLTRKKELRLKEVNHRSTHAKSTLAIPTKDRLYYRMQQEAIMKEDADN